MANMIKHSHDILRDRLLTRAGLFEPPAPLLDGNQLFKDQWNPSFEELIRANTLPRKTTGNT